MIKFIGVCFFLGMIIGSLSIIGFQQGPKVQASMLVTGDCVLHGSASDPNKGGYIVSLLWSKVSGPGCRIVSPADSVTRVTGLSRGVYVFKLRAVSSESLSNAATTTVTVKVN